MGFNSQNFIIFSTRRKTLNRTGPKIVKSRVQVPMGPQIWSLNMCGNIWLCFCFFFLKSHYEIPHFDWRRSCFFCPGPCRVVNPRIHTCWRAAPKVKSICYSPSFIVQAAHRDYTPRAAWVFVRLLLHRHSATGWAECMIYSALVSFF